MNAGSGPLRRDVLKWSAAVPAGVALGAGLASRAARAASDNGVRGQQGKKLTLKFGSSTPTHLDGSHTSFFDPFVTALMSKTNGDIGAIFYGDSQLGPEDKYLNQINSGTLDMMMTVSVWTPIVPELGVQTMGFLFDSLEQTGKVWDGEAGTRLAAIFKKKTHAEILGWGYGLGARNVVSKTPITSLADFHGKKLRVLPSPSYVQTFRLLGADPVPMSFNETYISLQTGVVDGLEHDPPTVLQFKFYEVAKYLTLTQHIIDPTAPVISSVTMAKLSPGEQQAVREAATAAIPVQRAKCVAIAEKGIDALRQNGMKILEIDRPKLIAAVKPLWTTFTDQHPDAKPVLQAILAETGKTL